MKIFGIGLNKTGTTTLGQCMTKLGFKHLSVRRDLLIKYCEGLLLDDVFKEIDRYESFEDWPYPLMYRELFERYGKDARYILTVRESPERWLKSLKAHCLTTHPTKHCRKLAYGYDFPHGLEKEHLEFYEKHNREVTEFFNRHAPDCFVELCWERGDDWASLCSFLDKSPPDCPFPATNSQSERLADTALETKQENERLIALQVEKIKSQKL